MNEYHFILQRQLRLQEAQHRQWKQELVEEARAAQRSEKVGTVHLARLKGSFRLWGKKTQGRIEGSHAHSSGGDVIYGIPTTKGV